MSSLSPNSSSLAPAIFALDHPDFNLIDAGTQSYSLSQRLSALNALYSNYAPGDNVWLVEPEDERIVKMEVIDIYKDTQTVAVGLAGQGGGRFGHSGRISVREVPMENIFGGFPAIALVPR